MSMPLWHTDKHTPTRGLSFAVDAVLYRESSQFQTIEIVQTPDFGKVMLLDGVLMVTEEDEFVYHEMLCHPSLFTHPNPKNVLIIGGGDCGTLGRVLEHQAVERAVQVEIDEMVTRVSARWFPSLAKAISDPRAKLLYEDGIVYMQTHKAEFDVILVDSTDPVGPAAGLFRRSFFADCHAALKDDGILCIQSESPWIPSLRPVIKSANADLRSLFPKVMPYTAAIQTYQAGLWLFQMALKTHDPLAPATINRIGDGSFSTKYYDADVHQASFVLPKFVKGIL